MAYPDDILDAEDKAAADLEKEFLHSVKATIKQVDWEKLERDLQAHREGTDIVDGLPWEEYDPEKALKNLFEVVMEAHGEYIGQVTGGAVFDYVDPNALKWLVQYGAEQVKYISDTQKEAIRNIIRNGYENGVTVRNQARQIREHIGLDPSRSETLRKYGENLLAKGKSEAEVWRLMEKRGRALLMNRANTIAVDQTSEAAANATYQSTKSAVERSVIDPNLYEGFRIVTADERTCTQCMAVEGEARKLAEGSYPSTGRQIVKVHTRCRCTEGLREIAMKKQSIKKRASDQGRMPVVFDCQALKRKDGILYVPTVPMIEGVYEQWGFRVLRSYAEFSQSSNWLHGIPIVVNHEEVTPDARRIGQLFDVQNKPEGLKTTAISRFYEIDCTQRELDALLSGKPHDGSLRWSCFLEDTPGEWIDPTTGERKQYDVREVGPYTFVEYSFVKHGVIGTNDGAGFNMQYKSCNHNHAPGGADMEMDEMKLAIEEAQKPLMEKIAALEQSNITLQGELKSMKEQAAKDKDARVFEQFQAKLKPGHQEKAKELFEASQKDPLWITENADKFVQPRQERKLQGQANTEGGDVPGVTRPYTTEEMNAEQAKISKKVR